VKFMDPRLKIKEKMKKEAKHGGVA